MKSKLKELRELIFKCEEVKKDVNNKVETLYRCNRIWDAWNIGTMTEEDFEEVEVYRDINLEDVLRVIEFKKPTIKITNPDSLNYGQVVDIADEEKIRIMEMWQLGKPLQFQSESTIKELLKLLS